MYYTEADRNEILRNFAANGNADEAAAIFEILPLFRRIAENVKRTEALQASILFFFTAGRIYGQKTGEATYESDTYTL